MKDKRNLKLTLSEAHDLYGSADESLRTILESTFPELAAPPKFVRVAGLDWSTESLTFDDRGHFNQLEAIVLAEMKGMRLPTKDEFVRLVECPRKGGEYRGKRGLWFADKAEDLCNPRKSLFLEAAGYRNYSDGALSYQGTSGYFWASTPYSASYSHTLHFYSGTGIWPEHNAKNAYGFSVRCVAR